MFNKTHHLPLSLDKRVISAVKVYSYKDWEINNLLLYIRYITHTISESLWDVAFLLIKQCLNSASLLPWQQLCCIPHRHTWQVFERREKLQLLFLLLQYLLRSNQTTWQDEKSVNLRPSSGWVTARGQWVTPSGDVFP